MAQTKVILLACGSFNPPTIMHLRMFELARDYLHTTGRHAVIGGVISPVHDAYGKKDLVSASHRCEMVKMSLESLNWVRLSTWETQQEGWTTTCQVLLHHQNQVNGVINEIGSPTKRQRHDGPNWLPEEARYGVDGSVKVKLLCGADLLESFGTPGLWKEEDIETIVGQHGLVVISREGSNPYRFIYESDLLTKFQNNIVIVTEWIPNEVSSTRIRRAMRRGESVKYLVPDHVIEYADKHSLFRSSEK